MLRRRLRRFILITGTTLCVLIVAAFVVSAWWWVVIPVPTRHGPAFYLVAGSAMFVLDRMQSEPIDLGSSSMGLTQWNDWDAESWVYGVVPIYAMFVSVLLHTLLVWRFLSKYTRGHCRRCGCNLSGLAEAKCPECGRPNGSFAPPSGDGVVTRIRRIAHEQSDADA